MQSSHRPELSPHCVLSHASTDYASSKVYTHVAISINDVMAQQQWENLEKSPNPLMILILLKHKESLSVRFFCWTENISKAAR
jgi:hypothetical protein